MHNRPRPKGMRQVKTAQNLFNRSKPAGRTQVITQLARLEHERMRLERELRLWAQKHEQTSTRLTSVLAQIEKLNTLSTELAHREGLRPTSTTPPTLTPAPRQSKGPHPFTLEY